LNDTPAILRWGHSALDIEISLGRDEAPRLVRLGAPGETSVRQNPDTLMPLVEVTALGHGRYWSGTRLDRTPIGARLRHRGHQAGRDGIWHTLSVELHDPESGLALEVLYRSPEGVPVLRTEVRLRNEAKQAVHLQSVTSLAIGGLVARAESGPQNAEVLWAQNEWLGECRWRREPLRLTVPNLNGPVQRADGRCAFELAGHGTWSSCGALPMGALSDADSGRAWAWQIEHNGGGWRWECGERAGSAYLALFGPCDTHHQWQHPLEPGEEFRTVPVALSVCAGGGTDEAFAALTRYRRLLRRPHPDHQRLPVVFNDFMNCLMGDPTTAKLLPHIDAAADAGAEYFVIDAGWYDGDEKGWWDTVGAWEPSATRFPGPRGIHEVFDRIRERGMVPGIWLEPEAVGVRSPIATALPDEAFFRRSGLRVIENGRLHLDLRHPAARAHLDAVVDRLVDDWGIGYLKLDHNVDMGPGTSLHALEAPGAGLLGHNRAHLDWLEAVLDRHPELVLENCGAGGMRMDYALLARMQLQSTSDQQNLVHYAPIAASTPTAVTPEQNAVWAYPLASNSLDEVAFTMTSSLLGRIHLSGQLPDLKPEARALVHEAINVYKAIRADLPHAVPAWPLGLPSWEDPWIALALLASEGTYVAIWRRPGATASIDFPLPHLRGRAARPEILYPSVTAAEVVWEADAARLGVALPRCPSSVLLRITEH
jgi:alpha-galactosidase